MHWCLNEVAFSVDKFFDYVFVASKRQNHKSSAYIKPDILPILSSNWPEKPGPTYNSGRFLFNFSNFCLDEKSFFFF